MLRLLSFLPILTLFLLKLLFQLVFQLLPQLVLHLLPQLVPGRAFTAAVVVLGLAMTAGCDNDSGDKAREAVDPALKNTLSDVYCKSETTVSLICATIEDFDSAANYRLQVATDQGFSQLVYDEPVTTASFTAPSKWTGSHFWRLVKTAGNAAVVMEKQVKLVNFYNDDDGDGLSNGLEMNGLLAWDLPSLGLDYQRKDIVVYMDAMSADYLPSAASLNVIRKVFKGSPSANPNGETGINLVLIEGNLVPFDANLAPIAEEFAAIKAGSFPPELQGIAHYMIWAYAHSSSTSSGYSFGIPASDFVVTLGAWQGGGSQNARIGTFIHELGHNLGLRHGGKTDRPYSPNYLSVMNYDFQIDGVIKGGERLFDFQRINTESLNETNLNELLGIGDEAVSQGYGTIYRCTQGNTRFKVTILDLSNGIDWNCDGAISTGVAANIDNGATGAEALIAQNDWANLNLAFIRSSSEGGVSEVSEPPTELTEELYLKDKALQVFEP